MKAEIIFLTAVLGIAGLHLLSNLVNFLSPKRRNVQDSSTEKVHDDWYVFFDKSVLYGDGTKIAVAPDCDSKDVCDSDPACDDTCEPQEAYS